MAGTNHTDEADSPRTDTTGPATDESPSSTHGPTNTDPETRSTGPGNSSTGPGIRSWPDGWRSRVDVAVLAVVVSTFGASGGLPGVAVAAAVALSWLVLPTIAVFAVGQVALVAVVPGDASLLSTAVPAVALGGLLCTTGVSEGRPREAALVLLGWVALTGLLAAIHAWTATLWLGALALVAVGVAGFITVAVVGQDQLRGRR